LKTLKFKWNNKNLKGSLPAELGDITSLEELELIKSGLTGEIPTAMGNLVNLHTFNIRDSKTITGEVPATFAGLSNLKTFSIKGTGIDGEVPELSSTLATCDLTDLSCYQSANTVCAGNAAQGNCHTLFIL
jgi:Leucine-rich repeat (LRR) protein